MNIQQYYRLAANISLNGSLITLVSLAFLVFPMLYWLPKKEIVFLFIPFLIYSFISYQNYVIFKQRSKEIEQTTNDKQGERHLLAGKEMLFQFMPAPSLRLLIFNPKGLLIGELRDLEDKKYRWFLPYFIDKLLPQQYGLFDESSTLISVFRWRRKGMVEISGKFAGHGVLKHQGKLSENSKNAWIFSSGSRRLSIDVETFFTDIKIKDQRKSVLARVRKGWMPLEWGQYFKDANTPVLSFNDKIEAEEKIVVFALLTTFLRYQNH